MFFTKTTNKELPITLELAKEHLRLGDDTHSDQLVAAKLEMAISVAEDITGRWIRPRSVEFDVLLNAATDVAQLPVNTQTVSAVSCLGKTIPKSAYVHLSSDFSDLLMFPQPGKYAGKMLHVTAGIGYTQTQLPPAIQAAILLILGTLYDNESDQIVGRSVSELSLTAEKLLAPWRINPYGNV
ncbi:hypothetical protein KML24007_04060 [Alistipes indistinctus]|uniref:hypothetical protein n=1 Tax=Alistipes indistinctus TaxID=626932 RepID=UPI0036F317DA